MRVLVIIPTYNERENVGKITPQVLEIDDRIDVLIVDDNSPDGTGEMADELSRSSERVKVMHRQKKLGLGSAYVTGFRYALEHGYEYVFEMDADFSHDPKDLSRFLHEAETSDLVVGSRYIHGVSVINWPMSRLLLSYFANVYARIITGVPIYDLTGGFKCYRRKVLESIDLDKISSDGYGFQIEMNFKAYHKRFQVKEIPIIFVERRSGSSKMSRKIIWEAFFLVWRLRFTNLWARMFGKGG